MNNINFSHPQETILLVDDSSDNLRLLSTMLSAQGYIVKKAISGKFALQALDIIQPDLILLDVNMPEMDGYQVCEALKQKEKYKSSPVIFISASDQILNKVKAFQVGGIDYITKPFHLEEVLIRIENQLNQTRLYQELQKQNELLQTEINERLRVEKALTQTNQKLELANAKLASLAWLDGLTGIANRRKFDQYFETEWKRLAREKLPLSLILIDVDYFNKYNLAYGHLGGDDCLKKVANTLNSVLKRPADLVARYGGEEFVIVLPNTHLEGAICITENIQEEIKNLKIPHQMSLVSSQVTLSIGINCIIPTQKLEMETFISNTDKALYLSKENGRNCYTAAKKN